MAYDFKWHELIDIAEHLVLVAEDETNTATQEAYYRSSANRSYYAAYKSSEDWLVFNGEGYSPNNSGSSHNDLILELKRVMQLIDINAANTVNRLMDSLRHTRKYADYEQSDPSQPWTKDKAERMISISRRVHAKLSKIS